MHARLNRRSMPAGNLAHHATLLDRTTLGDPGGAATPVGAARCGTPSLSDLSSGRPERTAAVSALGGCGCDEPAGDFQMDKRAGVQARRDGCGARSPRAGRRQQGRPRRRSRTSSPKSSPWLTPASSRFLALVDPGEVGRSGDRLRVAARSLWIIARLRPFMVLTAASYAPTPQPSLNCRPKAGSRSKSMRPVRLAARHTARTTSAPGRRARHAAAGSRITHVNGPPCAPRSLCPPRDSLSRSRSSLRDGSHRFRPRPCFRSGTKGCPRLGSVRVGNETQ